MHIIIFIINRFYLLPLFFHLAGFALLSTDFPSISQFSLLQQLSKEDTSNLFLQYISMISSRYCCVNPRCTNKLVVFEKADMNQHRLCTEWIIGSFNQSTFQLHTPQPCDQNQQVSLDFEVLGLNSIPQILKLSTWPKKLESLFEQMKERIVSKIESIKVNKIKEFQNIYNLAIGSFKEIKLIGHNLNPGAWFTDKNIQQFRKLLNFKSLNLYQLQKIIYNFQRNIPAALAKVSNLLQQTGQINFDQGEERRKRQGLKRSNYYFADNELPPNDKIQKLTYIFKKQMVKANFDTSTNLFKANCWICDQVCSSIKQDPTKNGCLQQLLIHLVQEHGKQVHRTLMSRVLRFEVDQIGINTLIDKAENQQIKQVYVIDRENAGFIEKPINLGAEKMWIQVVNKQNKNLAKGLFVVANSVRKDASDILITVLIYQLARLEAKKIILVTKDHFGVTLQQVLSGIWPQRMECLEPKDFLNRLETNSSLII